MNIKSLLIVSVLAAGFGMAGYFASNAGSGNAAAAPRAGELVLKGLQGRINDVSEMLIKNVDGEFHVKRQGEDWVLVEKDGYPVGVGNVRQTLLALEGLKTIEEKTSNPNHYSQLGVQSVGADPTADNQPTQIDLLAVGGEKIAGLIIGKPRSGGQGGTFYVRRPTEVASWLVEGDNPELPKTGEAWLDKKVIEIKRDVVKAVKTVHADGEELTVSKGATDANFVVHNMPEGRELTYAASADSLAGGLQYMNFEDVMKASTFEAPETPVSIVNFWTKDGMRVMVKCWEKDEKTYAALEASYDASAPSLTLGPLPMPAEGEAVAEATPRSEEEMAPEIKALNARLSPWVFQLPSYSKANLTKRLDGLLKPLPEPEEPAAEEAADTDSPIDIDSLGGE